MGLQHCQQNPNLLIFQTLHLHACLPREQSAGTVPHALKCLPLRHLMWIFRPVIQRVTVTELDVHPRLAQHPEDVSCAVCFSWMP